MELFQVLGNKVIDLNVSRSHELFDVSEFIGFWENRNPEQVADIASWYNSVNNWHQDNNGETPGLIVWSNIYPTEVLLPDGSIVSGEPNDVVLLNNSVVKHRTPIAYQLTAHRRNVKRHFIRTGLDYLPSDDVIAEWKEALKNPGYIPSDDAIVKWNKALKG